MKSSPPYNQQIFEDREALYLSAAKLVLALANEAVAKRGKFVIALSGGTSPEPMYELLAQDPFQHEMPWEHTFVFWGDERFVPADDERSNAHRAWHLLLQKVPLSAAQIYQVGVSLKPEEEARKYEETILAFFGKGEPIFDLILLGLGENGHTASLFPGTPVLNDLHAGIRAVFPESESIPRITMTAPLINQARRVLFLVSGANKAEIVSKVLGAEFAPEKFPAQLICPKAGHLTWYLDRDAAGRLV
jgi:6-phosphogluconolactonase